MLDLTKEYFKSQKWNFSELGENAIIIGIGGSNGNFQCIASVEEQERKFIFLSTYGFNVPEEKRSIALELINLLNCHHIFGSFEMIPESGEIRFKTAIPLIEHSKIELIEEIVITNIFTVNECIPALMGLLFKDLEVEKAFELVSDNHQSEEQLSN